MPLDKTAADQLKTDMAVAKKKPLNFGFCLASKVDESAFATHRIKKPELLGRMAKKEGGSAKLIFGTMTVEGRLLKLACAEPPKDMFAKKIKAFLKGNGIMMQVKLFDGSGNLLESDGEEDEAATPEAETDEVDPAVALWAQKKASMEADVRRFITAQRGDHSKVKAAWALALEAGDDQGDPRYALKIAKNIETLMAAAGGAPAESGEAKPKEAVTWEKARKKLGPEMLEMLRAKKGDGSKMRAVWDFANEKAQEDPPNYKGALKAMQTLSGLLAQARDGVVPEAEAEAEPEEGLVAERGQTLTDAKEVLDEIKTRGPALKEALKSLPGQEGDIKKLIASARSNANTGNLEGAQSDLEALDKFIEDAANRKEELLREAREQAESYRRSMETMRSEQAKTFGAKLPKALSDAMDEIDGLLNTQALDDPEAIDKAVEAAGEKMPAMEKLARDLRGDHLEYARALGRVQARVTALKSHDQAQAPLIAKLIEGVETKLGEATTKGDDLDYVEANLLLQETLELCETAETRANNVARYAAIFLDRRNRVNGLPDLASITDVDVRKDISDEIDELKEKMADSKAESLKEDGDFGHAISLLDEVPGEVIRLKQLIKDAAAYATAREKQQNNITALESWVANIPVVATHLVGIKAAFTASDVATTKSFRKSVDLLDLCAGRVSEINNLVNRYGDVAKASNDLVNKTKELESHAANDVITAEIAGMKQDRQVAIDQFNAQSYAASEAMFKHGFAKFEAAKKKADECHAYREELKKSKGKIDTYDDPSYPDSIKLQVEACKYWIGDAESEATNEKFVAAKAKAERATSHYGLAKSAYDGAVWAMNATPALDDIDKNWPTLWGQYQTLSAGIVNRDGKDFVTVKPMITEANRAGSAAQTAATAGTPDWATASSELKAAMDELYNAQLELDLYTAYKTQRGIASTAHGALTDEDGKFTAALEKVRKGIEETAKASAESGDWAEADVALDSAVDDCRVLKKQIADYKAFKAIRNPDVENLRVKLDKNNPKIFMKTDVPAFLKGVRNADKSITSGNYEDALKAIKELKRVGDILSEKCDIAFEAWKLDRDRIKAPDCLPSIEGVKAVEDLVQKLTPQITEMRKKFSEHHFREAGEMAIRIGFEIGYIKMFVEDQATYVTERAKAETAQKAMTDVTCDAISEDIARVQTHLDAAKQFADERVYKNAMASLAKVEPIATVAKQIGEAYALYAPVATEAGDKLDALARDFAGVEPVELRVDNQRSMLAKTATPIAARDFVAAKAIADEVVSACAEIRTSGEAQSGVDTLASDIEGRSDPDAEQIGRDIEALRGELAKLDSHAAKEAIKTQRARIKRLLDDAEAAKDKTEPDLATAVQHIKDAADQCKMAVADAESFAGVGRAVGRAQKRLETLKGEHKAPQFTTDILGNAEGGLARCKSDIRNGVFSSAMSGLLTARAEMDEGERIAKLHAQYVALRDPLLKRQEALASHKARYAIAGALKSLRGLFSGAEGSAEAQDYTSVMDLMDKAAREMDQAELTADMHANKKIEKADLEKVLSRPGGEGMLDKIIEGLDPSAQRQTCKLALEIRYGLNFTQYTDDKGEKVDTAEDVTGPNVVRLYKTLGLVPESHTKGNPSVNQVKKFGDGVGTSSFSRWTRDKDIKLRVGRGDEDHSRPINQEYQLGEVLDTCKPVDDVPPAKFTWTTLHEIGHAVDDKKGWMKKNGGRSENGGWIEYGSDVRKIAEAAADKFSYSRKYIEAYLSKSKMDPPPPEGGASQDAWDRARVLAETWCDGIRTSNNIWYSASASDRAMIEYNGEKRVYQEAYNNKWVSYLYDKRKEGVAGYQFRAPGEWFAELYAAYHSKKMPTSHPAYDWLKDL